MSAVYTGASVSLDGFISGPGESGFEYLFEWYGNGDIEIPSSNPEISASLTPANAEHYRRIIDQTGAIIVGRKLFDFTNAWGGQHPMGIPVVVLTHTVPDGWPREDADFHFVTTGIEDAVAKARELAGDKIVGVNGGAIASQCLNAGLLDEVWADIVPVLLGDGTPFLSGLVGAPILLEDPEVHPGERCLHLRYQVRKGQSSKER